MKTQGTGIFYGSAERVSKITLKFDELINDDSIEKIILPLLTLILERANEQRRLAIQKVWESQSASFQIDSLDFYN